MRLSIYEIAHVVQSRMPFIWNCFEKINEWLFILRYGGKLKRILREEKLGRYVYRRLEATDVAALADFFDKQKEDSYRFFNPHNFDEKAIAKVLNNQSYLAYGVFIGERIVGYYFLRSYFIGKSYLGKIVDDNYRGQGIGKHMCLYLMDVATTLGMHMYETISKDNLSSLYATQKVLETKIIEELPNNYLYIEDVRRKDVLGGGKFKLRVEFGCGRGYAYAA